MNSARFLYVFLIAAFGCLLSINAPAYTEDAKDKEATKPTEAEQSRSKESTKVKEATKPQEAKPAPEVPIDSVSVTTEQLANKPQDYLNKNIKFTAPFFAFSNLALDYKPAFRSSRTYLSFLVLRPNTHTPFSEIKMAMLIPKEKDPQTKMLQTLHEGDTVEITGHVFACPLDEPWLDVLRIKKIASAAKKGDSDDKTADASEDQLPESK